MANARRPQRWTCSIGNPKDRCNLRCRQDARHGGAAEPQLQIAETTLRITNMGVVGTRPRRFCEATSPHAVALQFSPFWPVTARPLPLSSVGFIRLIHANQRAKPVLRDLPLHLEYR